MPEAASKIRLHPFTRAVASALRRRCGVRQPSARLVVAVSGGADSVALLRALVAIAPARGWGLHLAVAHVNHRVRPDADDDARFVESLAASLGLPFRSAKLDPAAWSGNREAAMRRARYAALRGIAESDRCAAIVTAHHADDQLETMLMRLLRGASLAGLAGMRWRRGIEPGVPVSLLRPMLAVTRDEARRFLRDIDQPWREDATNADVSRWRAHLRRNVLPALHALQPHAGRKAVALADHLAAVERHLRDETDAMAARAERHGNRLAIARDDAARLGVALLIPLLRKLLQEAGAPPDALGLAALRPLVRAARDGRGGSRRFAFAGGVEVTVTRERISITPPS